MWTNFYKYWLHRAAGRPYGDFGDAEVENSSLRPSGGEVPLLLVRYEDLQAHTQVCLYGLTLNNNDDSDENGSHNNGNAIPSRDDR